MPTAPAPPAPVVPVPPVPPLASPPVPAVSLLPPAPEGEPPVLDEPQAVRRNARETQAVEIHFIGPAAPLGLRKGSQIVTRRRDHISEHRRRDPRASRCPRHFGKYADDGGSQRYADVAMADLDRFTKAQEARHAGYADALAEL